MGMDGRDRDLRYGQKDERVVNFSQWRGPISCIFSHMRKFTILLAFGLLADVARAETAPQLVLDRLDGTIFSLEQALAELRTSSLDKEAVAEIKEQTAAAAAAAEAESTVRAAAEARENIAQRQVQQLQVRCHFPGDLLLRVCGLSHALAETSRGLIEPSVSISRTRRSNAVDCSTRVGSTSKLTRRTGE